MMTTTLQENEEEKYLNYEKNFNQTSAPSISQSDFLGNGDAALGRIKLQLDKIF